MAARDTSSQHPVGRRSPPSGLIAVLNFLQRNNVVGSWTRVLQVAVLVCAPLLTVLVFGAVVVTALFYLKLDPVGGSRSAHPRRPWSPRPASGPGFVAGARSPRLPCTTVTYPANPAIDPGHGGLRLTSGQHARHEHKDWFSHPGRDAVPSQCLTQQV